MGLKISVRRPTAPQFWVDSEMYWWTVLVILIVSFVTKGNCGSGPVQKATIKGSSDVSALSDKSDTFDGKVVNNGQVKGNYQGKNGWIKNGKGDLSATQTNGAEKFEAYGPKGAKDKNTGTLDKKTRVANVVGSGGDKIVADASNDKDITAKVNGKET